jgi:hypothetical protein
MRAIAPTGRRPDPFAIFLDVDAAKPGLETSPEWPAIVRKTVCTPSARLVGPVPCYATDGRGDCSELEHRRRGARRENERAERNDPLGSSWLLFMFQ